MEHRDTMGNQERIGPFELQRISAGTGLEHSEINPQTEEDVHFLQIWIIPRCFGLLPSYEIKAFPQRPTNNLLLLASPDGRENSATIQQDVFLFYGLWETGQSITLPLQNKLYGWLQIIQGAGAINQLPVMTGDGVAISDESDILLRADDNLEFLFFDLN